MGIFRSLQQTSFGTHTKRQKTWDGIISTTLSLIIYNSQSVPSWVDRGDTAAPVASFHVPCVWENAQRRCTCECEAVVLHVVLCFHGESFRLNISAVIRATQLIFSMSLLPQGAIGAASLSADRHASLRADRSSFVAYIREFSSCRLIYWRHRPHYGSNAAAHDKTLFHTF